jgi:DNA-binding CsgD family transcriptional regulator
VEVVERGALPALILEVPSERILAASRAAEELLTGGAGPLEGRVLEEFMQDGPSGGLELVGSGRLTGYETQRTLARNGARLQVWIRGIAPNGSCMQVLAVLLPVEERALPMLPAIGGADPAAVLGTTDPDLLVERISSDVDSALGMSSADVLGQSLLRLVDHQDSPALLLGIAEATLSQRGTTLAARTRAGGRDRWCQLLLMPLAPPPSVGFMVLPGDGTIRSGTSGDELSELMRRFAQTIDAAAASRDTARLRAPDRPGAAVLSSLSSRELEIVGRLLAGDRVPAIARGLFLSPSTVRNHLSSAFRKVGVSSQQELIDLLRPDR